MSGSGRVAALNLTNYISNDVGIVASVFRLAQAAGVSSAVWLVGRSANPGRIEISLASRGMGHMI